MSIRLKLVATFAARKLIDGVLWIVHTFFRLISVIILRPLFGLLGFAYRHLFLRLYKLYLMIKKHINSILLPAKNKVLYMFSTRYVLHGLLVIIAVLVVTNNVIAGEIRPDEVGKQSLIHELVRDDFDIEIIETAETIATSDESVLNTEGSIASEEQFAAKISAEDTDNMTITTEGAIVKPDIASTNIGDRPNSDIKYHVVEGGETISEIASRYNVSVATILGENQIRENQLIKPGQRLTILPVSDKYGDAASHRVASGDTLSSIAKKYKTDVDTIMSFNNLISEDAISEGDVVIIPGVAKDPPAEPKPKSRLASFFGGSGVKPADGGAGTGTKLRWPTTGTRINQRFTWGHTGVDIGSPAGAAIYAADDGVVTKVSWIKYGYGHHIVIDHGNGMQTLYSHNNEQFVNVGDRVTRGQTIATIGLTGRTTGYHLHFETIVNGSKVNALNYLY